MPDDGEDTTAIMPQTVFSGQRQRSL
ncbi:MAG: hypothetical protein JWP51_4350, partial [Bradyrhizobium sp.]|nr:hypothetical protein [Bradyrhizobium sp.]